MSRGGWAALPRGAKGLSAVCDCGIPDHTHLLLLIKEPVLSLGRLFSLWFSDTTIYMAQNEVC